MAVLGIGVVIGISERDGKSDGVVCGMEEVNDIVHPDVEGGMGEHGRWVLGGEGCGEESDAG